MTENDPDPDQAELINSTEGLHLVDAGPGTGKTFAVTRRYASIVEHPATEPDDVLLVTFTDNAATEMKDRIVANSEYGLRELADAPIKTFHALSHDVLQRYGSQAPAHLGIDETITRSTRVIDDEIVEGTLFDTFLDRFVDDHPEYDDVLRAIDDEVSLLTLLNQLAAKGIAPEANGWYRAGDRHLDGDLSDFEELFDELNQPRNDGRKQSRLRSRLNGYGTEKCFLPDAPTKDEIRGDGKQVPAHVAELAFESDREPLKAFVHDLYHGYLEFALRRNYLNFGFLQLLAFVLLREDDSIRRQFDFEYVMIDEFQDTSEIQFKLALLLAGTNNICVVGDWKQSIYGFQYAEVENITAFEDRLERFVGELNADRERVSFDTGPIRRIELRRNYRSTQELLKFAEHGLLVPARKQDSVDEDAVRERIALLTADTDHGNSRIEAIRSDEEAEAVLAKVQEIVGDYRYRVEGDDGDLRPPEYGDIAVLTRTHDFGHELLATADEYGLPLAYEGGIELFRTDQAKLLLAWLRILENDGERGWAPVLERAGFTLDEIQHVIEREAFPDDMTEFRSELRALETVGGVARRVFGRNGYDSPTTDAVLEVLQSIHDATTLTRGDLIRYIEQGIEHGTRHEVSLSAGTDSVTVQTIHAAKGLEYPIVVLANMNRSRFPPRSGGADTITYDDPIGLRKRKVYADTHGSPHVYDNWRMDVLRRCLPRNYAEERRLLYVAMTRAESHLVFTAGERPNTFLEELPVEVVEYEASPTAVERAASTQTTLDVGVPTPEGPAHHTPHTLMNEAVFDREAGALESDTAPWSEQRRGTSFGTSVHDFAEAYALDGDVTPDNEHEEHIAAFIDGLSGETRVEESVYLPLEVDGSRVTVSGAVDLVELRDGQVRVIDYKSDQTRRAESKYRTQLSVYYHVARECYPDRDVEPAIFYTAKGELAPISPLTIHELEDVVREAERSGSG